MSWELVDFWIFFMFYELGLVRYGIFILDYDLNWQYSLPGGDWFEAIFSCFSLGNISWSNKKIFVVTLCLNLDKIAIVSKAKAV